MDQGKEQLYKQILAFNVAHQRLRDMTDAGIQQELDLLSILRERAGWLIAEITPHVQKCEIEPIKYKNRTAAIRMQELGREKHDRQIWNEAERVIKGAVYSVVSVSDGDRIFSLVELAKQ